MDVPGAMAARVVALFGSTYEAQGMFASKGVNSGEGKKALHSAFSSLCYVWDVMNRFY
jgi:hypothetical protein